jgi:hypothetical protein
VILLLAQAFGSARDLSSNLIILKEIVPAALRKDPRNLMMNGRFCTFSTEDKWAIVHERALRLLSDADVESLEEIAMLEITGGLIAQTSECVAAMTRFDDAFWTAMSAANVRFTISEMDQLLAGA